MQVLVISSFTAGSDAAPVQPLLVSLPLVPLHHLALYIQQQLKTLT